MANYYYLNSNVTESAGYYTSKQTGTWPTTNFTTYAAVIAHTTPPTDGDFIVVAGLPSAHYEEIVSSVIIADGVTMCCVESNDCAVDTTGGEFEDLSGTMTFGAGSGSKAVCKGLIISSEDDVKYGGATSSYTEFISCLIHPGASGVAERYDQLVNIGDGAAAVFTGCTLKMANVTTVNYSYIELSGGAKATFNNCTTEGYRYGLIKSPGNGGCNVKFSSCDLTSMISSTGFDVVTPSSAAAEDIATVELENCKMPATFNPGSVAGPGSTIKLTNCTTSTNRSLTTYITYDGYAITDNITYRTAGDQVGGRDVSLLVTTTAHPRQGSPFRFHLATIRHDFSSQTYIDVEICHDDIGADFGDMQNDEIYFEVEVPNSADPQMTLKTCGPDEIFDYTASTHTTNSEAWVSPPTADNTQKMTVDCGASGGEGWADIYVCVPKASVAADELYVCPTVVVRSS